MIKKYILSRIKVQYLCHQSLNLENVYTKESTTAPPPPPPPPTTTVKKHEWLWAINRICAHPYVVGKINKYYSQEITAKRVFTTPGTQALEMKTAESKSNLLFINAIVLIAI